MNSTLGFQKLLVLNLPFRSDRRDAITLAAATSNMKLEFVDGVTGESIRESAYPPPKENIKLPAGIRGSWRTHMNALQRVVQENLTTALIFEDDVDWDVRIRQNLQRFALASRFLSENKETLSHHSKYPLEKLKNPETPETGFHILSENGITSDLPTMPLASAARKNLQYKGKGSTTGVTSPYGDPSQWDILWIGHCGAGFPRYPLDPHTKKTDVTASNVILKHENDATVPLGKYLKAHPFQSVLDPLAHAYKPHTRVYHRASGGELCTVGYAVSQRGARRLLHQFGIKDWNDIFDSAMGRWCASEDQKSSTPGTTANLVHGGGDGSAGGQNPLVRYAGGKWNVRSKERVCLTSQPPIFAHHHPMDGESDIGGLGGGYATKYETKYLRLSVRMNLERIVQGIKNLVDQWPDEEKEKE
ncbi:glycosyltransferase family 25 protein [Aaosphaeria arxii CBS 175.79]|uniref:Glycosyltransferase family 25 protein n=1 Tax=Aaosphaeria arxii CBS 175.79 TaxID=1450172 RepID=A0A6A5Y079_9PLEO|nr:glycosyltransferase family 25 protein [Aaosphaeria arxii CBS 175.79]KAF2018938.1 glycosyltransferase family 25 protein [Aaosphaeria arxii CBS 175.79]